MRLAMLPRLQTSICRLQIILLKDMRLLFIRLRSKNEVLFYDGEFIKDEQVGGVRRRYIGNQKVCTRVFERVGLLRRRNIFFARHRLLCQRRTVAQLKLRYVSQKIR